MDFIELAAHKVAIKLKQWNPEIEEDVDRIRYGAAYYINYYSVIVVSLAIGFFSHQFLNTCLSLLSFGILRRYTGGYHFKSLTVCAVVSIALISLVPHINSDTIYNQLANAVSVVIVSSTTKDNNNKYMSLLLIGANFIFNSSVIALAFFVQSLSLLKGGEHK